MADKYTRLTHGQLETTLRAGPPENDKRDEGYALVNVLGREQYQRERIPGSINIPRDQLGDFEKHFDKTKKIVVYCASRDCPASEQAARELTERGFQHIYDFEGGMSDWREAGNPVESGAA